MTDSTPKKNMKVQAKETVKKMNASMKETLHASSDAIFFVRLFARACNTTPQLNEELKMKNEECILLC